MRTTAVFLALASPAAGFTPSGVRPQTSLVRAYAKPPKPISLSEIDDGERKEGEALPWQKYEAANAGISQADILQPTNYDDFIDSEGFDGGDGQVGVVGNDDNALDSFDNTGVVGSSGGASTRAADDTARGGVRSESKKTQRVAFGTSTGYAEQLAEQGMVEIDEETGEDKLLARRQQLENWKNQRELKAQQVETLTEQSSFTGTEYDPRFGSATYMNALDAGVGEDESKWNVYKGEAKADAPTEVSAGLSKGTIDETLDMSSSFPSPSFADIQVKNDVMSYEDFVVGFSDDTDPADWQVTPVSGTLNRRGGDPTTLSIVFKPNNPGGTRTAYIIVQTEESKFTYQVNGLVQ